MAEPHSLCVGLALRGFLPWRLVAHCLHVEPLCTVPSPPVDDELAAIEARAAAATPGPWSWWTSNSVRRLSSDATGKDGDVLDAHMHPSGRHADVSVSEADAAFIAASRADVPRLLARVRQAETRAAHGEHFANCYEQKFRRAEEREKRMARAAVDAQARVDRLEAALREVIAVAESTSFACCYAEGCTKRAAVLLDLMPACDEHAREFGPGSGDEMQSAVVLRRARALLGEGGRDG